MCDAQPHRVRLLYAASERLFLTPLPVALEVVICEVLRYRLVRTFIGGQGGWVGGFL